MRIHLFPDNISILARVGDSLLSILNQSHIDILLPCAGNGSCGKCPVRFLNGAPPADAVEQVMISAEQRKLGYRLACRAILTQDAEIHIPESIRLPQSLAIQPTNSKKGTLKKGEKPVYVLALDCGTTTLAAALIHKQSGQTVAVKHHFNPQAVFGADLISRIATAAEDEKSLQRVRQKLLDGINELFTDLCRECPPAASVTRVICAGNAVMNHFIRNVNPLPLAQAPFEPLFTEAMETENDGLFPVLPKQTQIVTLPNAGGFVGGDLAADLIRAKFDSDENYLLLDLGTNCEVALQNRNRIFITSAPAGPALEGASIACGTQAVPGAIDDILLTEEGRPQLHTIGDEPAVGICGSGLFHIIEFLRRYEVISPSGKMEIPPQKAPVSDPLRSWLQQRLQADGAVWRFNLTEDGSVFLTQKDIREFQLARAAIRTAWLMLCHQADCRPDELNTIFIAGAFGTFIRPETMLSLKMIPKRPLSNIRFIGNAALEGARMVATNPALYEQCSKLIKQSQFLEMAGREDFQELFIEQMNF